MIPRLNETLRKEAVSLFEKLYVEDYCQFSQRFLNSNRIIDTLKVIDGCKVFANNDLFYLLKAEAVITNRLFYFMAYSEGITKPLLQAVVQMLENNGIKGKQDKRNIYFELAKAKSNFGPCISFLSSYLSAYQSVAPEIFSRIQFYEQEAISKLRNSIAHFHFRYEIKENKLTDIQEVKDIEKHFGIDSVKMLSLLAKMIKIDSAADKVVDYANSGIRYSEDLKKPITNTSKYRSFENIRKLLDDIDEMTIALLFGFVEVGTDLQKNNKIIMGQCNDCGDGVLVVPSSCVTVVCPSCNKRIVL
jgi:hypothetical protein